MNTLNSAYLVVGQSGIVLQDMMAVLADALPGWQGLSAKSMAAALDLIDGAPIGIAFVKEGPQDFTASPLAARLAQSGARIVLMGDAAEEFGAQAAYPVLHRPFGSEDIVAIVGT